MIYKKVLFVLCLIMFILPMAFFAAEDGDEHEKAIKILQLRKSKVNFYFNDRLLRNRRQVLDIVGDMPKVRGWYIGADLGYRGGSTLLGLGIPTLSISSVMGIVGVVIMAQTTSSPVYPQNMLTMGLAFSLSGLVNILGSIAMIVAGAKMRKFFTGKKIDAIRMYNDSLSKVNGTDDTEMLFSFQPGIRFTEKLDPVVDCAFTLAL